MYSRKRTSQRRWIFVLSLLAAIIVAVLGGWQVVARRHGAFSPAEQALMMILSPTMRLATAVHNQVVAPPPSPLDPVHQLPRVGMERLTELEAENQQLRALLKLQSSLPKCAIAADVIGRSINPWQDSLRLGAGAADGVTPHMVALTPDGVLGQVLRVSDSQSELLLLTDRASGVGGMIARTQETGVLKGAQNGLCQLVYLSDKSIVQIGDEVVTSGLSDYFPKGLPLGKVLSITDDPALSSRTAVVMPATNPTTVQMVVLTK